MMNAACRRNAIEIMSNSVTVSFSREHQATFTVWMRQFLAMIKRRYLDRNQNDNNKKWLILRAFEFHYSVVVVLLRVWFTVGPQLYAYTKQLKHFILNSRNMINSLHVFSRWMVSIWFVNLNMTFGTLYPLFVLLNLRLCRITHRISFMHVASMRNELLFSLEI